MKKLIEKAETLEEAIAIQQLGTMWKKTGFSYDVRLEKMTDDIYYFKKDEKLSFTQPEAKQTHKLIIGDNYKALINLQQEYQGKIKMIYIDPPYGKDSMGQFAQTNYKNNITRDNLLSMLEPRLRLARQLLSDDGVIFCSIDDKNQAYVKILFDEVFGEGNFVACFNWIKKLRPSGSTSGNTGIDTSTEYILLYCKNINLVNFNKKIHSQKELQELGYTKKDEYFNERGFYKLTPLHHPSSSGAFQYQESLDYKIEAPDGTMFKLYCNKEKPKSARYTWSKELFDFGFKNGFIEFLKNDNNDWVAYRKVYEKVKIDNNKREIISEQAGNQFNNCISNIDSIKGTAELNLLFDEKIFVFSKPVALIQHLLKIASQKDSIILDFFAGSGTTGQAVLEQNKADGGNRQFILVQLDEEVEGIQKEFCEKNNLPLNLASITYERLKRTMTGKASDGNNFKWLEKNEKLGDNLLVCNVEHCANFDKNVFENIDETLYGIPKFEKPIDKINWVCDNFEGTQKVLENKDGKQENKQGFIEE